jgi:beta-lactamase superfamily II metal-dependent hydrolase
MPRTRTTSKRSSRAAEATSPDTLRVRMYRIGFGDFFLVTVPSLDGPQHIVIDCGVTKGKSGKGDIATIKAAVRHMADETDRQLALIIATHRHQDHIIGFSRCGDEFSHFDIGAVWMSYWETEYPQVQQFQADLANLALGLQSVALAGAPDDHTAEILGIVENATGVSPTEGPGGGTNAKSLAMLKTGLKVDPEYYHAGQTPKLPKGLVKAGLEAAILGPPPAKAGDFLALEDFKKQYLGAAAGGASPTTIMPFGNNYIAPRRARDYPPSAFREWAPRRKGQRPDFTERHAAQLEDAVKRAIPESLFVAAKKLDNMLNNQSLVVLFTWKGQKLLFAGDAQAGNWEYWLYDLDKRVKDPSTLPMTQAGKDILGSIVFYKVGHHGSTNATPITAVEAMGTDFVAMCSTEGGTFGSVENESEVPRAPLLAALATKSAVVRSDQIAVDVEGKKVGAAADTPAHPATPKRGKFVVGSCYIDYFL